MGIFLAAAASGDTCNASITTTQPLIIVVRPHLHQSLSNVQPLGLTPGHRQTRNSSENQYARPESFTIKAKEVKIVKEVKRSDGL